MVESNPPKLPGFPSFPRTPGAHPSRPIQRACRNEANPSIIVHPLNAPPPIDGPPIRLPHEKISTVILRSRSLSISLILLAAAIAATPATARASSKNAEEAGAVLFRDKGCSYCHGVAGTGGKKGPVLTNLRSDKQWPPEKITNQIMNGGQKMPPFSDSLSVAEIADLVAYLRAKHKPVPPPSPAPMPAPAN